MLLEAGERIAAESFGGAMHSPGRNCGGMRSRTQLS
jgi:hypothetical protein